MWFSLTRSAADGPSWTIGGRTPFGRPTPGLARLRFGCRSGAPFRWQTWGSMRTREVEIGAAALETTMTLAMLALLVLGAERSPAAVRVIVKFDPGSGHCVVRRRNSGGAGDEAESAEGGSRGPDRPRDPVGAGEVQGGPAGQAQGPVGLVGAGMGHSSSWEAEETKVPPNPSGVSGGCSGPGINQDHGEAFRREFGVGPQAH